MAGKTPPSNMQPLCLTRPGLPPRPRPQGVLVLLPWWCLLPHLQAGLPTPAPTLGFLPHPPLEGQASIGSGYIPAHLCMEGETEAQRGTQ